VILNARVYFTPGCKPIFNVEFAPLIRIVLTEKCTTEAEKCTFFGRKTLSGAVHLLTILEFFFEPMFRP
jgi:hypothetical protein